MKTRFALTAGLVPLLASSLALAQSGNMMDGGMWGMGWMGGYGGVWAPILLVAVIVGVAVLVVRQQKGK